MLPVDLNAILLRMELNIAAFALQLNQPDVHREFSAASTKRRDAMVRVHSSLCAQYNPCRTPRLGCMLVSPASSQELRSTRWG